MLREVRDPSNPSKAVSRWPREAQLTPALNRYADTG